MGSKHYRDVVGVPQAASQMHPMSTLRVRCLWLRDKHVLQGRNTNIIPSKRRHGNSIQTFECGKWYKKARNPNGHFDGYKKYRLLVIPNKNAGKTMSRHKIHNFTHFFTRISRNNARTSVGKDEKELGSFLTQYGGPTSSKNTRFACKHLKFLTIQPFPE